MFLFFNRFRTFFFKLKKLIYNFYKKKKNLILFNIAAILNVKQSSNFNEIVENDLINRVPIKKEDSFTNFEKTFNNLPKQSSPDQYVPRGSYSIKYLNLLQNQSLRTDDFILGTPAPQFSSDRFLGPNPGWFGSSAQYKKTLLLADDFWSGTDFTYFFGLNSFKKSPVLLDENCLIDLVGLLRYPDLVIHTWSEVYNDFFYSLYIFNLNKFEYLSRFQPVLLFLLFAIILTFILSFASRLFVEQKGQKGDAEKRSAYECGFEPFEDARNSFDVNFYLVAILFILFDLEIVFLMPWTVSRYFISSFELFGFYLFNVFLTIGFVYEWRKGALDWY